MYIILLCCINTILLIRLRTFERSKLNPLFRWGRPNIFHFGRHPATTVRIESGEVPRPTGKTPTSYRLAGKQILRKYWRFGLRERKRKKRVMRVPEELTIGNLSKNVCSGTLIIARRKSHFNPWSSLENNQAVPASTNITVRGKRF